MFNMSAVVVVEVLRATFTLTLRRPGSVPRFVFFCVLSVDICFSPSFHLPTILLVQERIGNSTMYAVAILIVP